MPVSSSYASFLLRGGMLFASNLVRKFVLELPSFSNEKNDKGRKGSLFRETRKVNSCNRSTVGKTRENWKAEPWLSVPTAVLLLDFHTPKKHFFVWNLDGTAPLHSSVFARVFEVFLIVSLFSEPPPDQPVAVAEAPLIEGAAGWSQRAGFWKCF